MSDVITYHRFVRHEDVDAFAKAGWKAEDADLGHHSRWSRLTTWTGSGEPPEASYADIAGRVSSNVEAAA